MRKYFNARPDRTPYEQHVNELLLDWKIKPGDNAIIIGANDGETCDYILERFPQVELHTFDPQLDFAANLMNRYSDEPNVRVYPFALGDRNGSFPMVRMGGVWASFIMGKHAQIEPAEPTGMGDMCEWVSVLNALYISELAWLHCNIEGYEYTLLPHIIKTGWIKKINQLVVMTHGAPTLHPDASSWDVICTELYKTHKLMWNEMGWYAFERN